jgi:N-methylhydantoinase B
MSLDPITLSVMVSAFSGIAEEMGTFLVRSAYSANIKERRDCSAALFDAEGRMIAQAEHIPVHLGAMPESVAVIRGRNPQIGDVFVLNDPYTGGSHLPDVTMISPLGYEGQIMGYGVTRAHHADIGGMRPGSMPGDSTEVYQEGLIIPPVRLFRSGELVTDVLDLLTANVRTPQISRGDYRAQAAANQIAETRLSELIERVGLPTVKAAFGEVIAYAERRAREVIRGIPDGVYRAETEIEGDGSSDEDIALVATVTVAGDRVDVDFSGTAAQVPGNVNCPAAVTRAACCFALRVLMPNDVPANEGTFAPLTVNAAEGTVVNACRPAAVCAGNVETSSRIADMVLMALGQATDVPACGQGTMNVLTIGGADWTYLETLAGGQGASSRADGSSGVHVAMTNTLNTPVEAVETAYPLRVERYELRNGSGGLGCHSGGDGLVRSIRALRPATVSVLSDRRRHDPSGTRGGAPGRRGRNLLNDQPLSPKGTWEMAENDVITLETPGGGGWGMAQNPDAAIREGN